MERNREARRGTIPATANGLSRRRQRSSSLRDSPEEDGGALELQEMARLRDRANKKDRDRDRDRLNRSKRRRGERLLHGSNREDGGEESSEESLDDDDEEDDEDVVPSSTSAVRLPSMNPMAPALVSSSVTNHHHHQRKSFPPKVVRAAGPPWKVADEMIGVSVPRKARSGSVKRSHEFWNTGGGGGSGSAEQIFRQASTSPARPTSVTAAAPAPVSPSSSNASARKKLKPIGAKNKPPKISKATSSSSIQEIEIEVAEVLFGLTRQFQSSSKQETETEGKDAGGSSNDAKSRVSSPVSASPPPGPHPYLLPQSSSSTALPSSAVAPKRKKPRPVKFEEESPAGFGNLNVSTFSAAKPDDEQLIERVENSSPKIERNAPSSLENGGESSNLGSSHLQTSQKDSVKMETDSAPDSKPMIAESDGQERTEAKDDISLPVEQSPYNKADVNLDDGTVAKTDSTACAVENPREEKFKFDLMAPPSAKSSPERDAGAPGFQADLQPSTPDVDLVPKSEILTEDVKAEVIAKQETGERGNEANTMELTAETAELQKQMPKERNLDLQLDVDPQERDTVSSTSSKQQVLKQQQQQSKTTKIEPKAEKAAQCTALPLPMTVPGWQPGSFPPLGYMGQVPAVQPVASMDRSTGSSTAMQPPIFFPQKPQPKRCATHFYIAKNIDYHQQVSRMNLFWPTAAGSAAPYGTKPYNLNAVPPAESTILLNPLQGSLPGRNLGSLQDKGQTAAFQGQSSKEKSLPATFMDVAQKKQLMVQQAPQPASANSILQAPAFIFPMNQQAAAAATATRSGPGKSPAAISHANPSSGPPNSVGVPVASVASSVPTTVSFNYANLPTNDSQYLAIVPNNGYPFPIPAPVGAPPPYRGNHAQAMPFFSGPFFAPHMLHPSQIQQQQHPQSQSPIQQGHQNTSTSSGSSSSQKQQHQQQLLQSCSSNARNGTSQSFPALKQRQQAQPQNAAHQARLESEAASEDSPSTSDGRVLHAQKNAYNHNFAIPVHPQNFALMSSVALAAGNHSGEKQQQPQQQQNQSVKGGMELTTPQAFAMSFASFNGTAAGPGLDFSSMAHSHPVFHSLPEAARHGYQMAAAAAAQSAQKKNHSSVEEGRAASDSVNANPSSEDDKKTMGGKGSTAMIPHSLVFSRPEGDPSMSTILSNSVIDSSARTLNLISAPANGSRATSRSATASTAPPNTAVSASNLASQQQLIQLQKQQAAARSKPSATNNANVFTDRLQPPAMAKFPNPVSVFPQALIQGSSPNQSQWKNSARTAPIQSPTATMQSMKSLPQQQGRVQVQGLPSNQTQISFGVNPKSTQSGQQLPSPNPPSSAGIVVGSPPASISKGSAGSPMTSAGGKVSPPATMPSQPAKNSQQASSSRKSSPVGGRNVPSIQSNSHASPVQSSSSKPQQQQQQNQQQQAQLQKQPFQQAQQLFFSNAYLQSQSPHSAGNANAGFYQRREQQQQPSQQNSPAVSSSGMMSIGSPSLTPGAVGTTDPAKAAAAAAANNLKTLPPPSLLHAAQFAAQSAGNPHSLVPATFPYIHAMPAAVAMKPAEQKPVAGNEPEKR